MSCNLSNEKKICGERFEKSHSNTAGYALYKRSTSVTVWKTNALIHPTLLTQTLASLDFTRQMPCTELVVVCGMVGRDAR